MADQSSFVGVTRLQLLDALRAGPLDKEHVAERFGGWPKSLVSELKRKGLLTSEVRGYDVTIRLTPKGKATLPSRQAMARAHWLDEGVA